MFAGKAGAYPRVEHCNTVLITTVKRFMVQVQELGQTLYLTIQQFQISK